MAATVAAAVAVREPSRQTRDARGSRAPRRLPHQGPPASEFGLLGHDSSEARERRMHTGHCLRCGQSGHAVRECCSPPQAQHPSGNGLPAEL